MSGLKKQAHMMSRMAFLMRADMSVIESIRLLCDQARSPRERRLFEALISGVARGDAFSDCLTSIQPPFDTLAISMIRTGERTGTLAHTLFLVAEELTKRERLRRKMTSAFLYPVCIAVATLGIAGTIVLYVLPKITPIFSGMGKELPFTTRTLIAIHHILQIYWVWFVLVVAMLCVTSWYVWSKTKRARMVVEQVLVRVPLCGGILRRYEIIRACRTISTMLSATIPIEKVFYATAESASFVLYAEVYKHAALRVTSGAPLYVALADYAYVFPDMVVPMVRVGESSGSLRDVCVHLADLYEKELDDIVKNLSSVIEPVLMVVMGLLVGFIAISIISPIYGITQQLRR